MTPKYHYSIHGDSRDGWRLMVYRFYPYKHGVGLSITPAWLKARQFDSFDELMVNLNELMREESES
jgi:hypothetical protein